MQNTRSVESLIPCGLDPTLLRRGTLVYDLCLDRDVTVVAETDDGDPPKVIIGPVGGKLIKRGIEFLYLDLSHPLGKANAISWLRDRGVEVDPNAAIKEVKHSVQTILRRRSAAKF